MNKLRGPIALAAMVLVLAGLGAWFDNDRKTPDGVEIRPGASDTEPSVAAGETWEAPPAQTVESLNGDQFPRHGDTMALGEITTLMAFRERLQGFFEDARTYPVEDHEPAAAALLSEIDAWQEGGYLTAPEALTLRLSLLRYAVPPDEYDVQVSALLKEATERAETMQSAEASRRDPRHEQYRKEERHIVEQSLAMESFPGGVTRQAYVRQRLRDLRAEIYKD